MGKIVTLSNLRGGATPETQIRVMIGMLSPGSMINWQTQECFEAMLVNMAGHRLKDGRCKYDIRKYTARVTNIFAGRNKLCKSALSHKSDWLLMIDSDMTFPSDSFERMFAHGKDIISALAFKKSHPYTPVIARRTDKGKEFSTYSIICNWVDNALIKVDGVGTAFLLINMDIIRKMEEPWFYHEWLPKTKSILGSDYYFCAKAEALGHQVWVDTSLKIGHIGEYNFGFEDYLNNGGPVKEFPSQDDVSTDYETLADFKVRWEAEHKDRESKQNEYRKAQ